MDTIYLDYNATTPLDAGVRESMLAAQDTCWGNPSSVHRLGRQARALLDECRERTATVLGAKPGEIVFTSGGTESNNLAVLGAARTLREKGRHLITSSVEHPAVLHCFQHLADREGFEVDYVSVDRDGRVAVDRVERLLRRDTILVSVMAANNEVGTLQPVAEIGALCRARGVRFHTDAVQWFGKEPFQAMDQFHADLVSMCAHKFHGPKGAGALFIRSPFQPASVALGGAHENERRAGTENLPAIAGFTAALERFVPRPVFDPTGLGLLATRLRQTLEQIPGVHLVSPPTGSLANTVAAVVENTDSITLLANLDLEGICASSGSACASGSLEPSHVVRALGWPEALAHALLRLSLGRGNTPEEVAKVADALPTLIKRARTRR